MHQTLWVKSKFKCGLILLNVNLFSQIIKSLENKN
jgi:hypothetical protein